MTQIRLTESITHQRATPAGRRLAFLLLGFKSPLHMNPGVKKKCNTVAPNDPYPVFLPMKCKERRCRAWLVRSSAVVFIPLKGPVHPAVRHGGRSDCSTQVTDWQDAAVHRLRMALCKHPYCSIKAPRVLQNKATRGRQCSSFANTTDVLQCCRM